MVMRSFTSSTTTRSVLPEVPDSQLIALLAMNLDEVWQTALIQAQRLSEAIDNHRLSIARV